MKRIFIHLKAFDKNWASLGLTDDDLLHLQKIILENPKAGRLIQGTGGLRKLRFALPDRGKSGGTRVLYVDYAAFGIVSLMGVYAKSSKGSLTAEEKSEYKKLVVEFMKELKK